MSRMIHTDADKIRQIREWYERHKHDYSPRDPQAPPKVWAEYFGFLLQLAEVAASPEPQP